MSGWYRNTGAPFTASTGQSIARGQVFQPTREDLARRAYKLEPVAAIDVPADTGRSFVASRFAGVDFASDAAYERARDAGLTAADFAGRAGTGADGAWRKQDIDALIAEREADGGAGH